MHDKFDILRRTKNNYKMSEERDIDTLNEELNLVQIQMDLLKRKQEALTSSLRQLEEARRLDPKANLSPQEERKLREALLIIGHSICSPHAIIGHLLIIQEEPPANPLSNKYLIKFNVFDLIQDIGNFGIVYNIKIITKSAHVIKIIRETFSQEGNDSLSDEPIDDTTRISWTTNWDNYCRIRHVDIDH